MIILVTATYSRANRLRFLERCIGIFSEIENLFWIVVEDGAQCDPDVALLLAASGIPHRYLQIGPTTDCGSSQKNLGLEYVRQNDLHGVVYLADDDNGYDIRLFAQIRQTRRLAILPVGNLGPNGIERPLITKGKIVGWDAGWATRKYPVDWAGVAFSADVLKSLASPLLRGAPLGIVPPAQVQWPDRPWETESDFLDKLIYSPDELEPLCGNCSILQCYVFHNQPLDESLARSRRRIFSIFFARLPRHVARKVVRTILPNWPRTAHRSKIGSP